MVKKSGIVALLALCPLLVALSAGRANQPSDADRPPDLGRFVTECMHLHMNGDESQLTLWIPFEFFVAANRADSGATDAAARGELAFLKPYIVTVVQRSSTQPDGMEKYESDEQVRKIASLTLPDGRQVKPLTDPPPMVAVVAGAMKTMMGAEGDAGGRNLHVLIFAAGEAGVDGAKKGKLTLHLAASGPYQAAHSTWHTPFDTLVPASPCEKCGGEVSAKFSFCPWCGNNMANSSKGDKSN